MTKRIHYSILTATFLACVFTILDAYQFPEIKYSVICTHVFLVRRPSNRIQYNYYFVDVKKDRYGIDQRFYNIVSAGDTIYIGRSAITKANKFIEIKRDGQMVRCNIGFINNDGILFLGFITIATFLTMVLYEKVPYKPGQQSLVIFFAIFFVLVFYLHLIGSWQSVD